MIARQNHRGHKSGLMARRVLLIFILLTVLTAVIFYLSFVKTVYEPVRSLERVISIEDDWVQWFKTKRTKKIKGVALVVHGLNMNPERMQSIIAELNAAGIDVLNLSLRGHGNNYLPSHGLSDDEARLVSFQTVTYRLWMNEMYTAYLKVRERAIRKNVPVYFIGYSLGALMGCDLLLSEPDAAFDRMILFAPALRITADSYLLKALAPFPNVVIDSLSPAYYRSNKGTPVAAYNALFDAVGHFDRTANAKLDKPTLIFIDEKDEFVPFSKLTDMIRQQNLEHWQIHLVRKDKNISEDISYHLIIDRGCVGKEMWSQIKEAIGKHLNPGS